MIEGMTQDYILKCKKAEPIKSNKHLDVGDVYYCKAENKVIINDFHTFKIDKQDIWLPRIDQLIYMNPYRCTNSRKFFIYMTTCCYSINNKEHAYKTIEEHLLAIYMYYVHDKHWLDEEEKWEKIERFKENTDIIKIYDESTKSWIEKEIQIE